MVELLKAYSKPIAVFIGTLGTAWVLLEPFNLHEHVLPHLGLWRYLILLLTAICLSLLILVMQVRGMLNVRLYKAKIEINSQLDKICANAKKRIWTFGVSNRSLVRLAREDPFIAAKVLDGVNVRWMNIPLDSPELRKKEMEENGALTQRIRGRVKQALYLAETTKKSVSTTGHGSFECRSVNATPTVSLLIVDNTLWFSPYLYRLGGNSCPMISIERNALTRDVFEKFEKCFLDLWKDGKELFRDDAAEQGSESGRD